MTIPRVGSKTPWGRADSVRLTPHLDIYSVSTASHGGFKVTGKALAFLRTKYPLVYAVAERGWFEEDAAWCLVVLAFPTDFAKHYESALRTAKNYYPDIVTGAFGIAVPAAESDELRRRAFLRAAEGKYKVVSAFGDWCQGSRNYTDYVDVPDGMVGALTRRVQEGQVIGAERAYLLPRDLYRLFNAEHGCILDPQQLPDGVVVWAPR
jgi:hypothetical protein